MGASGNGNPTGKRATLRVADGEAIELPVLSPSLGNDVIDIGDLTAKGYFTYDPGFVSTASCDSNITYIDGDAGVLLHRGYPIEQLAAGSDFLELCQLLLSGELPSAAAQRAFREAIGSDDEGSIYLRGNVYCRKAVLLRVGKEFETRYSGNTLRVRCHTYAYIAWRPGENLLLKYHNLHRDDDAYHHRIYDPATGKELLHETLERYQFPIFTEVLDELEILTQDL